MSGKEHTSFLRRPLITKERTYGEITNDVLNSIEGGPTNTWYILFAIAVLTLIVGLVVVGYQLRTGIGVWGLNKTIG